MQATYALAPSVLPADRTTSIDLLLTFRADANTRPGGSRPERRPRRRRPTPADRFG